jgi:large subunit ribosomal protein L6
MSRIGNKKISFPANVKVTQEAGAITVDSGKNKLTTAVHPKITVNIDAAKREIAVVRGDDAPFSRALHGLTRSLIANMIEGVTKGYEKRLKIEGIGYQARMDGKAVVVTVGYANPAKLTPPAGITVEVPDPTTIVVKGFDKQKVGQFAADIRFVKKPEPYKGKGIRYENETVRRKEGKSFSSS